MRPQTLGLAAAALTCAFFIPTVAHAQKECADLTRTQCSDLRQKDAVTRVLYLDNITQQNDANEVLVALRNIMDPGVKIFLLANQNAVVLRALPSEIDAAQTLVTQLTRPRRSIRLHYTVRTLDGTRIVSTEHYDVDAASGQRVTFKQGRKVPVATGSSKDAETQFTYIDVGASIDATPSDTVNGISLKTKVERSSVADDKVPNAPVDPVIHQSTLEGVFQLAPGKSLELGRADIDGTTQHIVVEASADFAP